MVYIYLKVNPLHPTMLAKFGWIGLVVLEKNFKNFLEVFCYFFIISPRKKARLSIWTHMVEFPLTKDATATMAQSVKRSLRKRKVWCSNPNRDKPKS